MSDEIQQLKNLIHSMKQDALRRMEVEDDLRECWAKAKGEYKKCYDKLQAKDAEIEKLEGELSVVKSERDQYLKSVEYWKDLWQKLTIESDQTTRHANALAEALEIAVDQVSSEYCSHSGGCVPGDPLCYVSEHLEALAAFRKDFPK